MKPHDDIRKPRICEWDENDRPRERFSRCGGGNLTSAELLAILIGSGNARETAVIVRMLADEVNASGCSVDVSSLSIKMLDESASNVFYVHSH